MTNIVPSKQLPDHPYACSAKPSTPVRRSRSPDGRRRVVDTVPFHPNANHTTHRFLESLSSTRSGDLASGTRPRSDMRTTNGKKVHCGACREGVTGTLRPSDNADGVPSLWGCGGVQTTPLRRQRYARLDTFATLVSGNAPMIDIATGPRQAIPDDNAIGYSLTPGGVGPLGWLGVGS
jgi:hypothetical protein